jgi:hypothetical protein
MLNLLGVILIILLAVHSIACAAKSAPKTQKGYDNSALVVLCVFGVFVLVCLMSGWVK